MYSFEKHFPICETRHQCALDYMPLPVQDINTQYCYVINSTQILRLQ